MENFKSKLCVKQVLSIILMCVTLVYFLSSMENSRYPLSVKYMSASMAKGSMLSVLKEADRSKIGLKI